MPDWKTYLPLLILQSSSSGKQIVKLLGKQLPREVWHKLTVIGKFEKLFGLDLSMLHAMDQRARLLKKLQDKLKFAEKVIEATPLKDEIMIPPVTPAQFLYKFGELTVKLVNTNPFISKIYEPLMSQYSAKLRPTNEWRGFLWGQRTIKRGRQSDTERVVSFALRMTPFTTPKDAALNLTAMMTAWVLWSCYVQWFQGRQLSVDSPPTDSPPTDSLPIDSPPTDSPPTDPLSRLSIRPRFGYRVVCTTCCSVYYFTETAFNEHVTWVQATQDGGGAFVMYCPNELCHCMRIVRVTPRW